jgi:hypothetical protein
MARSAYQLKVTLRGTRPPIWRRLEVASDLTLERLHDALQGAMGWTDSHLHAFVVDGVEYGPPDPEWGTSVKDESRVRLARVLRAPKDRLVYQYDFGDDWQHVVALEKVLPFDAERHRAPLVTGGRRACPPEDCGGVYGYYRMLDVLGNEDDPEHEEMHEWVGDDFDPDEFDVQATNLYLRGA